MRGLYLADPRCPRCDGSGIEEVLTRCCGATPAWAKACGCNADGMVADYEPCACLRPVSPAGLAWGGADVGA
jgi:hypothetical protein